MQVQTGFQEIIVFLLLWSYFVVMVESLVELGLTAEPLEPFRTFLSRRSKFLAGLLSCGYCFSVWVAFSVAWVLPSPIDLANMFNIDNYVLKQLNEYGWWFVNGVILHRMSNIFHVRIVKTNEFVIGDIDEQEA